MNDTNFMQSILIALLVVITGCHAAELIIAAVGNVVKTYKRYFK